MSQNLFWNTYIIWWQNFSTTGQIIISLEKKMNLKVFLATAGLIGRKKKEKELDKRKKREREEKKNLERDLKILEALLGQLSMIFLSLMNFLDSKVTVAFTKIKADPMKVIMEEAMAILHQLLATALRTNTKVPATLSA